MGVKESLCSKEIFEKSLEVIPGGVNSPVRAFMGLGIDPLIVEKGEGALITDVDGKTFIDYCMSWGALLHGHAHPEVVEKSVERLRLGSSFGIATAGEEELARIMVESVPSLEKVRFVSSGTEAAMTAVRLARGYTSRPMVLKFNGNYHGHYDGFLVKAGSGVSQVSNDSSSDGIPKDIVKNTISIPYNDPAAVRQVLRDPFCSRFVAAVILEPIAANMGVVVPTQEFLETVREETRRIGALLIFDEVITGYRVAYGGAQESFGIEPDLSCFGKIVGGGFPAAAFGGKREVMDYLAPKGKVYQAGTLSGNPVAMAGGIATLKLAQKEGFYQELKEKTEVITNGVRKKIQEKGVQAVVQEAPGMFTLFLGLDKVQSFHDLKELDKELFGRYFRHMWNKGIYISPSPYEACFISAAHTEDHLIETRDAILAFLETC